MIVSFSEQEIGELRRMHNEYLETRRNFGTTSAYGHHYLMVAKIKQFGIDVKFEDSAKVNEYVEHVITYGKSPW